MYPQLSRQKRMWPAILFLCLAVRAPYAFASDTGLAEPFAGTASPLKNYPFAAGPNMGYQYKSDGGFLQDQIKKTGFGEALDSSRITLSGWIQPGLNVSSAQNSNLPMGYSIYPNSFDLNEFVLKLGRTVDVGQKDHIDWGFQLDALYGVDYYMYISKGFLSGQGLVNGKHTGVDIPQAYGDLYIPQVADGMNLRAGRIRTNPTVNFRRSFFFTHTVFDNNTGDTNWGVIDTLKLNSQFTVQAGFVNTADNAFWTGGDKKASGYGSIQWTSPSQDDSLYFMAYGINDGNFAYHNWQTFYGFWSHRFSPAFQSRLQTAYFYEKNVPVGTTDPGSAQGTFAPGTNFVTAKGWSIIEILAWSFDENNFAAARFEYTADRQGTLTGTSANYTTYTLGWGHNFNSWVSSNLDLRRDRSFNNTAYDQGTSRDLFLAAGDITIKF